MSVPLYHSRLVANYKFSVILSNLAGQDRNTTQKGSPGNQCKVLAPCLLILTFAQTFFLLLTYFRTLPIRTLKGCHKWKNSMMIRILCWSFFTCILVSMFVCSTIWRFLCASIWKSKRDTKNAMLITTRSSLALFAWNLQSITIPKGSPLH